jgi:hypothetical protein
MNPQQPTREQYLAASEHALITLDKTIAVQTLALEKYQAAILWRENALFDASHSLTQGMLKLMAEAQIVQLQHSLDDFAERRAQLVAQIEHLKSPIMRANIIPPNGMR